ncbi:MAG: MBL fold metallo-hydrolase [Candidatus Brocadiia bacterium]
MKIQVFDVLHGFCSYLIADNGNVMLFDCGHNEETGFRPSKYLSANGCSSIERFFITNYDDDHVSDLANLRKVLPISILHRNKSITPDELKKLKEESGPLTEGLLAMINMANEYSSVVTNLPEYPSIEWEVFSNKYPVFKDTNNLSLVTFIHYDGMGIVFPGDIEKAGWEELLKNKSFCEHLKRVNIFIASHHGRESGYCENVFSYCKPDIIFISDEDIKYDTQNVDYKKHAYGVPWNSSTEKRYVLTTRSDGMITITKEIGKGYHIAI